MAAIDTAASLVAAVSVAALFSKRFGGWGTLSGAISNTVLAYAFTWLTLRTWGAFG